MRALFAVCLLVLSCTFTFAVTTPQYTRQDLTTPFHNLGHVATADFNGDGKPDLAVTSSMDASLLVFLNKGDGTFAAALTFQLSTQQNLATIFAGDFNEDGKQDLVVTTLSGQQEAYFLAGNGDGTFQQGAIIPQSGSFLNASVVDFNQDGHLDLVTANNGNLTVYLGDGHGAFAAQPFLGPGGTFFGLTVADFNKDHHLDIVTGEYTFGSNAYPELGVRFYAGNGDGSVQPATYSTAHLIMSPYQFASADFDGDGNLDVLFSEPDITVVLFGNGDGTFKLQSSQLRGFYIADPSTAAALPPLVVATDMNADGKADAVVVDTSANSINIFLNDGTSAFYNAASFSGPLDPGSSALAVADLNGDGLLDVVVTNNTTQKVSIFLTTRQKSTPTLALSSAAAQVLVGTPLSVTARVSGSSPAPVATGSVSLLDGSATLGQQNLDSSGQANFSLSSLATGSHSLSFTYTGDQNYLPATSQTFVQSITDFQVALPSPTQTISRGGTATYSFTVTPVTGLAGTATVSCSGLPSNYACPTVTAPIAGQAVTVSLLVSAPVLAQAHANPLAFGTSTLALLGIPFSLLLFRRRSDVLPTLLTFTILLGGSFFLNGCSSGNTTPSQPAPVTSSFTITASVTQNGQTVTHSVPATLTVN